MSGQCTVLVKGRLCKNPAVDRSVTCNSHNPERIKIRAEFKDAHQERYAERARYERYAGRYCRGEGLTIEELEAAVALDSAIRGFGRVLAKAIHLGRGGKTIGELWSEYEPTIAPKAAARIRRALENSELTIR